jgi:hypothetical protein
MKLLFSGASVCSDATLKRLMLVTEQLGFMDRPIIMFGSWGMVGHDSPLRQFERALKDTAVCAGSA